MLDISQPLHRRSVEYISKLARRDGVTVSLEPTPRNRMTLAALWEVMNGAAETPEVLASMKQLCDLLYLQSQVPSLQGIPQRYPEEYDQHAALFKIPDPDRMFEDRRYMQPVARPVDGVQITFASDCEEPALTPDVQLSLFDRVAA